MNCREIRRHLDNYVADAMEPALRETVGAHLQKCLACRQELAEIARVQSRIRRSLHDRVADATPSPQAWSRVRSRLEAEARPRPVGGLSGLINTLVKGVSPMRRIAYVSVLILFVFLGTTAFVPGVRAQIQATLSQWFNFRMPNTQGDVLALDTSLWGEFQPYSPTYLPEGFRVRSVATGGEPGAIYLILDASTKDHMLVILQHEAPALRDLPEGKELWVNRVRAAYVADAPAPDVEYFQQMGYTGGNMLVWFAEKTQIVIYSDLAEAEILRIGKAMEPAEPREEGAPFVAP